jgi:hypothetical protein
MADAIYPAGARRDDLRRDDDTSYLPAVLKRTSWGAVLAGAVVAIGLQMILSVIGIAVGATATTLTQPDDQLRQGFPAAAGIWWLVTGTLSLFVGGCVVGRFAGMTRSPDVLLHGLVMWGVTALFGLLAVSSSAGMVYATAVTSAYTGAEVYDGHRGTSGAYMNATDGAANSGAASTVTDMTPAEAEEARRYVRTASWWSVGGLLLGVLATVGGSWLAAPQRIVVRPPGAPA